MLLGLRGGGLDGGVVGDIGRDRQRLAAAVLHVAGGAVEPGLPAGDQRHVRAAQAVQLAVARAIPALAPVITTVCVMMCSLRSKCLE